MPIRQSNSDGVQAWATTSSDSRKSSGRRASNSAWLWTRVTPREKLPSGRFRTQGSPTASTTRWGFPSWTTRVAGAGIRWRRNTSAWKTLLEHRMMESGSSMTTSPSWAARRARRYVWCSTAVVSRRKRASYSAMRGASSAVMTSARIPSRAAARISRPMARASEGAPGSSSLQRMAREYANSRGRRAGAGRRKNRVACSRTKGLWESGISEVATGRSGPVASARPGPGRSGPVGRGRETVEERPGQGVVPPTQIPPEVDGKVEGVGAEGGQDPLDLRIQLLGDGAEDRRQPHGLEGGDGGERAVAPGCRQEGHIVPEALVRVPPADVVDRDPSGHLPPSDR
jgi:hypothetical protein